MSQANEHSQHGESYKWFALVAIVIGTFAAVLNSSLLNVALPSLVSVFGSTTQTMQWVLTGYMLASAVVIPMSGFLGDRFGYKKILIISLAGFTAGSLLCGFAWSEESIIAFRVIQGIAGGLIMPIGMSMIYMIIPRQQIGMALGIWGIASMSAPAIGPTLSGYIIEIFNWRMLFFMTVPIGILAVFMCMILLRETPVKKEATFDKVGAIFSVIAFGSILLALSKGQQEGWTSLFIVSLFFIGIFSLALLIWVETGQEQPLMDLRMFKIPAFSLSVITSSLVTMGMYGGIFLTPIYLQNIQGLTPVDTGLVLMPQSIAMALMMPISGRLFDKFGVIPLGLVGLTLIGVTTYELHLLEIDTPNHWLDTVLTIRGIGIGLSMMPLSTVGMNAVPRHLVGRASSLSNVIRQVLGSLAIAIFTAIMTQRGTWHGSQIAENVQVTSDMANQTLKMITGAYTQGGVDTGTATAAAYQVLGGVIQKEALVRSIGDTFLVSSIPIFICIPLIFLFLRKKKAEAPVSKS
ncbi:DHA2 family efflux MFS transporter permease subunit [Brevibacillus ginsengisoli]|uniref:DHA2 family efflux MFS transporter permease subunit n=1 Tax=Brevibacillus ginsengisoli TaxID=363854 RepID=UPI003CF3F362